jgi:hypothetical protein
MTGIKAEHAHQTRESRDKCAKGNCDRRTIVVTWPPTKDFIEILGNGGYPVGKLFLRTLNNIELVHIMQGGKNIQVNESQLDDLITQLMYAKWYFTEGKYNEQTT